MIFEDIIGKEVQFFGVDNLLFKVNDTVFEVKEDPDDGWRSYLGSIKVAKSDGIFFNAPLATVIIKDVENEQGLYDGYELVDIEDGHVWLTFGTDYHDDWYPHFVFYYEPNYEPKNGDNNDK